MKRVAVLTQHLSPPMARHSNSSAAESEVLYSTDSGGCVASLLLNRPKALHSLNINMIRLLSQGLKRAEADASVKVVFLEGEGEKAFCAGGDIRAVTEAGKVGGSLARDFFREEYTLNHYTGVFPKPYICIQDGITMGGGVGMSVHGPFRVATEKTLFAMPETFIGLFPDVGGSHFLPRLTGSLGMYLALTGYRLKARDVVFAGIATHFIPRNKVSALKECISSLCGEGGRIATADPATHLDLVRKELDRFHQQSSGEFPQQSFSLDPQMESINRCFDQITVEGILKALQEEGTEWAAKQLETLSKMSPTALKVTHHQLREGEKLTFKECFKMEYRMSQGCMAGKDFYEGVRAVIVDKDNKPKWEPASLSEVTQELVLRHFSSLPEHLELKL